MHIRQHRNVHFILDLLQNPQPFLHPRPAKTTDRRTIRLVVRGLENKWEIERPRHALDNLGHAQRVIFAFDHTRPRNQEEIS